MICQGQSDLDRALRREVYLQNIVEPFDEFRDFRLLLFGQQSKERRAGSFSFQGWGVRGTNRRALIHHGKAQTSEIDLYQARAGSDASPIQKEGKGIRSDPAGAEGRSKQ